MYNIVPDEMIRPLIVTALAEDLAQGGDLTSLATIEASAEGTAVLNARQGGVVAGLQAARLAFSMVDSSLRVTHLIEEGTSFDPGSDLLRVEGGTRALLAAERTALNLLSHLSGVATLTNLYTNQIEGTGAKIAGTRKTLPGLRLLQKHSIRCGGGFTHRMSLSDAVMIKDNHIAAAGSLQQAIDHARRFSGHTVKIEVEVDTLDQLGVALKAKPDIVLLDNMTTDQLHEAVSLNDGQAILEASGGVTLETVRNIAETGVDIISVGALTHSAPAIDIGMDLQSTP